MEALIALIGAIGLAALLIIYGAFAWGYVIYVLYNWFVLTALPDLPHFTVIQFIGFSLFLRAIMPVSTTYLKDEYENKTTKVIHNFLGPWIILSFSWLIKVLIF